MEKASNTKVSVIIASYNGQKYIDRCLNALVNQTYENIEIIICDDASEDGSVVEFKKWQKRDSRIVLLQNEKNIKISATRNKCICQASGKYILIQDIDDVSELNRVEILVNSMECEKVDFMGSAIRIIDDGVDSKEKKMKDSPQKKDFLYGIPFFHPSMIFTKESLELVDGYRIAKETRRGEDYDMLMRMYARGLRGKNIPDVLYNYSQDINNFKRQAWWVRVDEFYIRLQGFRLLGLMPIGYLYALKPFLAHIVTQFRMVKFLLRNRRKVK